MTEQPEGTAVWVCNRCQFSCPVDPIGRALMREHLREHAADDRLEQEGDG